MPRYRGKLNENKKWSSKTYVGLKQSDIMHLSESDLRTLIRKEGKSANSRLRRLRKRGELDSAIVQSQYKHLEYNTYGTKKGYFAMDFKGETLGQLREHYLAIRGFMSYNYTAEGMVKFKETLTDRIGGDLEKVDAVFDLINKLFKEGYTWSDVDSSVYEVAEKEIENLESLEEDKRADYYDYMLDMVRTEMDAYIEYKELKKTEYQEKHSKKRFK